MSPPKVASRGFTLIELLVAMTAAMFVAVAAYALARQGSRFFQQEARIANAQYSVTVGFDRLRADLARAAFLSTPNIQRDPRVCAPQAGWGSSGLASLGAVRLENGPEGPADKLNSLTPHRITLSGSYVTAELFPVRTVLAENNAFQVYLQTATGAVARATGGQADAGSLGTIFQAGRMLRLLEQGSGRYEFGVITAFGTNTDGNIVVTLAAQPAIPFKATRGICGIDGFGTGTQASVISWIRYDLRQLSAATPGYAKLFTESTAGIGDDTRSQLVREELDAALQPISGTLEIVADYSVDLRFGFTVVTNQSADPVLARYAIGASENLGYGADVAASNATGPTAQGPERIRSIHARLTVRSREADREAQVASTPAPTGNIYRYHLPGGLGFARTRTVTGEVSLPNLAGLAW